MAMLHSTFLIKNKKQKTVIWSFSTETGGCYEIELENDKCSFWFSFKILDHGRDPSFYIRGIIVIQSPATMVGNTCSTVNANIYSANYMSSAKLI